MELDCGAVVFLAAGYLLAGHMNELGWYKRECFKRVRTLVVPFFFWCLIGVAIVTALDIAMHRKLFFGTLTKVLYGIGFYPCAVVNPTACSLWFVRALVLLVLISPLLKKFMSVKLLVFLGLLYAVLAPFDGAVMSRVFRYGFSLEGLFYFAVGIYLRTSPLSVPHVKLVGAISLVTGSVLVMSPAFVQIGSLQGGYVQWVGTPLLLLGTWALVPDTIIPKWLTSCSFPVYVTHRIVLFVMLSLSRNVPVLRDSVFVSASFAAWFMWAFLAFSIPVLFAVIIRKTLPRMASVIFGGR